MKTIKIFIYLILLIVYINCYSQNYSKYWKDINYADDTMVYHRLDIYLPEIKKEKYPVIIAIYGSAWFANNMKESVMPFIGKRLLNAGFAVVAPNHRSSHDAKFPAQIHDIKAVIRFVRANSNKYLLDTSFIGITGFPSGGHLAALAGTSGNAKLYNYKSSVIDIEGNIGSYLNYSTKVDAVVDWFGPIDLLTIDSCRHQKMFDENTAPEVILIGSHISQNKEKYILASPITYIDKNDPPFLIIHGEKDELVPYCQSKLLYEALLKEGVPVKYILVPGGGHGPGVLEDSYLKMMTDFFVENLKRKNGLNSK